MEPDFWHERWTTGQIGFHQAAVNPYLTRYWDRLEVPAGARVFVPLCGKSRDMTWLLGRGYAIVGAELSRIAVRDYFREAGISPAVESVGSFCRWSAPAIDLIEGDFFALETGVLGRVDAVYDRAALIAMPAELRGPYARQLARLTPAGARALLVTMTYDESQMMGPPFSVSDAEVGRLFEDGFVVQRLYTEDALDANPHFRERGLTALTESVWRLDRR